MVKTLYVAKTEVSLRPYENNTQYVIDAVFLFQVLERNVSAIILK